MRNAKRRLSALGAAVAATALLSTACGAGAGSGGGSDANAGKPVKGGTLNMLGAGDVDYLDPNVAYYSGTYTALRLVSRQLFTFPAVKGKTETAAPDLAEEIPTKDNGGISEDGKTYTIKLRQGVKWNTSPQREVVAADYVTGIKRTCNPIQPFGGLTDFEGFIVGMQKFCDDFANISKSPKPADIQKYIEKTPLPGVEAKDDHTLVFHLTQPVAYMVDMLTLPAFSPAPKESLQYEPGSSKFGQNLISDGPYKVDSYDPTKSLTMSRNPAWDASTDPIRKAYVDKIAIKETGEQGTIQKQLQTNSPSADMEWDVFPPPTAVPGLHAKKDPNLSLGKTTSSNPYVVYNTASPNNGGAMGTVKFRQAMSYAMNRDHMIQVLGGKLSNVPLTHVLPAPIEGSKNFDLYPHDESKAKSLMQESGQASPTIKILYRNSNEGSTKVFETLQSDLSKVGVKVQGVQASNADFYTKYLENPAGTRKGVWDMAIAGWGSDWYGNAAASFFLPLFYGQAAFPKQGSNFGLYNDPKTVQLIDEATKSTDTSKWADADKQVMEDAAFYPITNNIQANYKASHVHNAIYMEAFQNFDPANVWIEKNKQD